jgi:hypothetical protein
MTGLILGILILVAKVAVLRMMNRLDRSRTCAECG